MGTSDTDSAPTALPALLMEPGKVGAAAMQVKQAPPAPRPKTSFVMNYTQPTYPGRIMISYFWASRQAQGDVIKVRIN
jgi:hypothetical protein